MSASRTGKTRLAYVVPTKDRRKDLERLLNSFAEQTVQADQIVIVDASDPPIRDLIDQFPSLPITYVREFPPSLARQRNAGMAALKPDITVAGYIDDDIEMERDATECMLGYWDRAVPQVGGASFTIINQPLRHPVLGRLADFFLINGRQVGAVLSSGFATSIVPQLRNTRTQWLYGGATLWRREVIAAHSYDEWYLGHGYLEDLDYSYRVSQTHELWVVADAKLCHYPHPIRIDRNVDLGRQQVVNRLYFVRKMGGFSKLSLSWGLFGQALRNLLETLWLRERGGVLRLWGNLQGIRYVAFHGTRPVEGIWK